MAKINAKSVMYVLLPVLLLQLANLAGAVDIIFYENKNACTGSGYSFNSIAAKVCCQVSAKDGGSVLVTSATGSTASKFYRKGACSKQVGHGSGNFCLKGGDFTGAFWFHSRRRSLLDDRASATCDSQMKPSGVVFTEDGKGHWILTSSEPADLYAQMQKVPAEEKVTWLKFAGAIFKEL